MTDKKLYTLDDRINYAFDGFYTNKIKCRSSRETLDYFLNKSNSFKYDLNNKNTKLLTKNLFDAKFKYINNIK